MNIKEMFKIKPKEPVIKIFCAKCGIRVKTMQKKGIEYANGFLCSSCAAYHTKMILENRKKEENE